MAFNYKSEYRNAASLGDVGDNLDSIKDNFEKIKNALNYHYKSNEVVYYAYNITYLQNQIDMINIQLDGLARDIKSVAYQLYLEDKAEEERQLRLQRARDVAGNHDAGGGGV